MREKKKIWEIFCSVFLFILSLREIIFFYYLYWLFYHFSVFLNSKIHAAFRFCEEKRTKVVKFITATYWVEK